MGSHTKTQPIVFPAPTTGGRKVKAELRCAAGPCSGEIFPLDLGVSVFLGRDANCGIQILSNTVSRYHAVIERRGEGFHISDLESANGTFVNGVRIREKTLAPGDVIRAGEFEAVYRVLRK